MHNFYTTGQYDYNHDTFPEFYNSLYVALSFGIIFLLFCLLAIFPLVTSNHTLWVIIISGTSLWFLAWIVTSIVNVAADPSYTDTLWDAMDRTGCTGGQNDSVTDECHFLLAYRDMWRYLVAMIVTIPLLYIPACILGH